VPHGHCAEAHQPWHHGELYTCFQNGNPYREAIAPFALLLRKALS
jgi:hypothetical protein